jgi:uncharacterized membrane protein
MREDQDTAHRLAAYSDAVFAVIVTIMVLELEAPEEASFAAVALVAHGHQLRSELSVYRHHLDQPPPLDAVRGRSGRSG